MRAAMRSLALLVLARTDALAPPLTIVAESATWIVVDKPSGTPCHSAGADDVLSRLRADGAARGEAAAALAEYRLAHRLDDGTSGCLAIAKDRSTAAALGAAFRGRTAQKAYVALTASAPKKKKAVIRGDLVRARRGSWKLARTCERGACACTVFTRTVGLGAAGGGARKLLVARPVTGKSHQIRVAAKANGSPLLGDARYGGAEADRLYLHAAALRIDALGIDVSAPPSVGSAFLTAAFRDAWGALDWAAEFDAPLPKSAAHAALGVG